MAIATSAAANEKVRVVYTSTTQFTPGFVAIEQGFFARHGLDVTYTATTITSTVPAALVSGSTDIGGLAISTDVQAVDGGLDLLTIAGTGLGYPDGTNQEAVARVGVHIVAPQDYIGKRVGMPGVGSVLDILFRNWLMANHVDPDRIDYVEVATPQLLDALRADTVDAVVANDPQLSRLKASGAGVEAGKIMSALPGPLPSMVYATSGDYARSHRATILAFQAAHNEGVAWVEQHPDEARETMARWLHFDPATVRNLDLPHFQTEISPAQIGYMIDMLARQNKLQQKLNAADLVFH